MAAITWRNVDGRSLAESAGALNGASNSMNNALGTLESMLKQRQSMDAANWDNTKVNNTNAIQARLASAKTPEELAAMEGEIAQMGAAMGAQVDPALLRDGVQNQLAKLRQQGTQAYEYTKTQRAQATDPHREAYANLVAQGKADEAEAYAAQYDLGSDEANQVTAGRNALRQSRIQTEEDALRPGQQANKLKQQELDAQALAAQGVANNERLLTTEALNATTKQYNESRKTQIGGLRTIADSLGLSKFVDKATGLVDASRLSDSQLLQYEEAAKKAGVLQDVDTGSAYITQMRDDLARQGVSAMAIEKATAEAQAAIRGPQLSAEDAGNLQSRLAKIDADTQKIKESNPAYEEPGQSQVAQVRIFEKIPELLSGDGTMTHNALKAKVSNWMNNGIQIAGETVKVPARVVELALAAGAEKGSWLVNSTDTKMEKFIKDYMVSPEYIKAKKEADLLLSGGYDLKKDTATRTAMDKAGNVDGNFYLQTFINTLNTRKEAAAKSAMINEEKATADANKAAHSANVKKLQEQLRTTWGQYR